ncbi:hypothetical protein [Moorena sp. SIO4A5]|uniref:hypothetical protein n=1 Tax=Moorena sp. SIO4A5 TaxID=2607838 RepID=UPI0013CC7A53|nr:hypothetical protein [Moorena sp. SIO4A5]NEO24401.1 hypothetical protein [Moorena sp. SIO4A5]
MKRQVTPYLGHTERAATPQSEAGTRAQSEPKQIGITGANGEVTWVKLVLEKCLRMKPQSGMKNVRLDPLILTALFFR